MMNQTVNPKREDETEENEYEGLTLEEKMESMGFWIQDSLGSIQTILKRVVKDHYLEDKEGQKTDLTLALETIDDNLGEIGLVLNTMEAH